MGRANGLLGQRIQPLLKHVRRQTNVSSSGVDSRPFLPQQSPSSAAGRRLHSEERCCPIDVDNLAAHRIALIITPSLFLRKKAISVVYRIKQILYG